MKKLTITAAMMAALATTGYASVCSEPEATPICRAWNVQMNLKTLAPKKTKCLVDGCGPCGDSTSATVYYMTETTRKLKGYVWICDYSCEDDQMYNCVLWDEKNKCAVIAYTGIDNVQQVSGSSVYAYGKKADKVTATIEFAGNDATGDEALLVTASGLGGKLDRPKDCDCYLKSLSGHATGMIKYVKPGYVVKGASGTLCADPEPAESYEDAAKLLPMCAACCFDGWCDVEDAPDLVPCVGTWKMKINKKVSNGTKSISQLVPAYAL